MYVQSDPEPVWTFSLLLWTFSIISERSQYYSERSQYTLNVLKMFCTFSEQLFVDAGMNIKWVHLYIISDRTTKKNETF